MAKYRTIRDCYFNSRLYKRGEVADFADSVEVPNHFAQVGSKPAQDVEAKVAEKAAAAEEGPKTMHEMAKVKADVAEPTAKKATSKTK